MYFWHLCRTFYVIRVQFLWTICWQLKSIGKFNLETSNDLKNELIKSSKIKEHKNKRIEYRPHFWPYKTGQPACNVLSSPSPYDFSLYQKRAEFWKCSKIILKYETTCYFYIFQCTGNFHLNLLVSTRRLSVM